jgi:hypothetical protein
MRHSRLADKSKLGNPQTQGIALAVAPRSRSTTNGAVEAAPGAPTTRAVSHARPAAAQSLQQVLRYQIDFWQRSVLFLDTLRARANNMFAHEEAGMPPPLDFDYETILDARRFARPANYALLRITRCRNIHEADFADRSKAPVIILDPRAGHGPGIGGSKHDSEVGMALHEGHPTYFVTFFPLPSPNQTLADVLSALRRFVEEVRDRHREQAPVLYGNCQAGWAAMLLAADCEGLTGPTVLNGSPLSYWAGESDVNPMRLSGGLLGGVWLTHLLTDMSDGRLDGAWLVQNFETLNPAHSLWGKNYRLFASPDTERERFLEFERWWCGFYFLSREEILSIVENLFIGNKLERGQVRICPGCTVDLKRIRNPLIIFASSGDNITPPHQALHWISVVYSTDAELEQADQRIVYLLNRHVGHLGIFVSAEVARLEHRAILESLDQLNHLRPGLYEMKIENPAADPDVLKPKYRVRFEKRALEQIRFDYPEHAFEKVRSVSEWNELLYSTLISPWVSGCSNPLAASALKWLHPMRASRILYSEKINPWMGPVKMIAPHVQAARWPADESSPYLLLERQMSDAWLRALDAGRCIRDAASERLFSTVYGSR